MSDTHKNMKEEIKNKPEESTKKSDVALREEEVLEFWKENDIFNKSVSKKAPNGDFVFYDGPPFATGLPHVGSLLSSVIKDVVGRYWTMKGYRVERRWGWDCHGLPIENMIEKELGLKSKKDIYELGVGKFNEACRSSVLRYAEEWKQYITRIGRWTEYDNAYKTMDNTFMESVWWFVSEMHKRGHLYEGRKVLLYCPHCETPLSKAEIAMDNSYKDVTEESVYVKFKILNPEKHKLPENTYLLAWTTTPWTLPGNVALALGEEIKYSLIKEGENYFIVADDRISPIFGQEGAYKKEKVLNNTELVGVIYEPLYPIAKVVEQNKPKAFTVLPAGFVTTGEGTGIVHTAVIYGEDDYQLGQEHDLPMVPLLDQSGHFTKDAPELIAGKYFKQSEKFIKEDLEKRGLLFKKELHTHSYPHCYRCGTALLYNALVSWFLNVQKIKEKMLVTNEDINWFPDHLKHGRYKNILENAPDWSISRNRFWATPLPIWKNPKTENYRVFGSLKELQERTTKSGNQYFIMRHGEAQSNLKNRCSTKVDEHNPLTDTGIKQVVESVSVLKKENVDFVIASPFMRTKQTVDIVKTNLGLNDSQVIFDERLGEVQVGVMDGCTVDEYHKFLDSGQHWSLQRPDGGESWLDVKKRVGQFIYEIEKKYQSKNILIIAHNSPLRMLGAVSDGNAIESTDFDHDDDSKRFGYGEVRRLNFIPIPHTENFELDYHRPYIDEFEVFDEDGTKLERIPEVIDCWVESGSMPFAAQNYPHAKEDKFTKSFPADFIAEYIAQTRTWFYYMHTVSVLLFGKPSFKNVVATGNILAEDGAKMSKSKKNYTDPMINLSEFGADAMRFYLMNSVVMQAEDLSFKDQELKEVKNRLINILWNSYLFYDLNRKEGVGKNALTSGNILDRWILSRISEIVTEMSKYMDSYDMLRAMRPVRLFVEDFSTWYVRRSRERLREDSKDGLAAAATMRHVLLTFSKLMAPVTPFIAESIYRGLGGEMESVHLENWPNAGEKDEKVLEAMSETRRIVSAALQARTRAGIKVRQPLSLLKVKKDSEALYEPYVSLIMDEVNVKKVEFEESLNEEVELDLNITPELKNEGDVRDLMRVLQDLRKLNGLSAKDKVKLNIKTSSGGEAIVRVFMEEIKSKVGAESIEFGDASGDEVKAGEHSFTVEITKC